MSDNNQPIETITADASTTCGCDSAVNPESTTSNEQSAVSTPETSVLATSAIEVKPTPVAKPAPIPHPQPRNSVTPTVSALANDPQAFAQAAAFGRVEEDGTVWVKEGESERTVGQYTIGNRDEALQLYVRRFLDLQAQVALLETRFLQISIKDINAQLASLREQLIEPAAVGDLEGLRTRVEALVPALEERKAAEKAEREAAREKALTEREALVAKAEGLANQDPTKVRWKQSGEQIKELLDAWKDAQRRGPRLERSVEDSLWKRFSAARTNFDRQRRQYFSELDNARSQAKAAKEALIARAEELSTSQDWGRTAGEYRELMEQWRTCAHASRREDEQLWARFRAAQEKFFTARTQMNKQIDAEYNANLEAKLAILEKAEALLPVQNLATAKQKLRELQDQWEGIGRVPRAQISSVENRMRAVENALRDAEQAEWRRTNPETKARAAGLTAQLHEAIARLEAELTAAKTAGDAKAIAKAEEDLAARRQWLELVKNSSK